MKQAVKTTIDEMISAKVPPDQRDYCVDLYMKFLICRRKNFPWIYKCKHEVHDYHNCQFDDYVLRMKELERERRLTKIAAMKEVAVEA